MRAAAHHAPGDGYVVAELAWLLGWKHHDLGQEGAVQAYYRAGLRHSRHTHITLYDRFLAEGYSRIIPLFGHQ
jgi:hypothetical protein